MSFVIQGLESENQKETGTSSSQDIFFLSVTVSDMYSVIVSAEQSQALGLFYSDQNTGNQCGANKLMYTAVRFLPKCEITI